MSVDEMFARAAAGLPCWIRERDRRRRRLPLQRWMGGVTASSDDRRVDEAVLDLCTGATLDLGCGPGRLTAALTERGITALGVDDSAAAVALCRARGGIARHQDLFAPLPRTGRWRHVLLADGNIGIGGDPLALLHRTAQLLEPGGTLVVEVGPPDAIQRTRMLRFETDAAASTWFPWTSIGSTALAALAKPSGLRTVHLGTTSGRFIAVLERQ
ncbi:methyltransferase domain-containing protein [Rhodococcoides yunnanense]|uniref:Methyltransferase domain-containing protein n=1 Tax=Rhodococcoides yunnanense TaxID=278209 RepID=A0ABU4BKK1_9NOCA|nr:methyltransferase domain-containing protein [Rhodococcus yunnanensis]MDV6264608.1 methyltransferase domain-containing protein [Rhodococcus yunnanensis]